MERACLLVDYLIVHAKVAHRIMAGHGPGREVERRLLGRIIDTNAISLTVRDATNLLAHQGAGGELYSATVAETAMARLEELGYLRRRPDPPRKIGRPPSPRYLVNPITHNEETS